MTSYSNYQQPAPMPPPDFDTTTSSTGPAQPFFSADSAGNLVLGAPLVTSSFAAPTGASSVNFSTGVVVGGSDTFPASTGAVALEIPVHQTLGLAQSTSLLVSDFNSNPYFYATSDPSWTGPTAHVFGSLLVDGTIYGPSGAYPLVGPQG